MADFDWSSLISPAVQAGMNYYSGQQVGQAGQQAQRYADPFGQYRPQYANALAQMQSNPSSVANTPGYQFTQDQAMNQIGRSAAAQGYLGSGNVLTALQDRASGIASQQFNNERDFLGKASGAYNNPFGAAQLGLGARMDQLGAYGQGVGALGSAIGGAGAGGAAGAGGSMNSLANMLKGGKQAYDAYTGLSGIGGGAAALPAWAGGAGATGAPSAFGGAISEGAYTAGTGAYGTTAGAGASAAAEGAGAASSAGSAGAGMGLAQWAPIAALGYMAYKDWNAPEEHNGDLINRIGSSDPEKARQMQLGMANGVIGDFQKALNGTLTTNPYGVGGVNADSIYATYGSQYLSTADKAALKDKTDALFTPENYKAIQQWASQLAASNANSSSG